MTRIKKFEIKYFIIGMIAAFLLPGFAVATQSATTVSDAYTIKSRLNTANFKYAAVIDAGSKGNRIHLYQYDNDSSLIDIKDIYVEKNQTPLASFVNHPSDAGTIAIAPLLKSVATLLEKDSIELSNVVVSVLGTAGMRLIPESTQQLIYASVDQTVQGAGFKLGSVKTITGQSEGVYTWIDANYKDNIFKKNDATEGSINIGGASAQITFATTKNDNNPNIVPLTINNVKYYVYSVSFLGLGLNQALASMKNNLANNPHLCYPEGSNSEYINGIFHHKSCSQNYAVVLANPEYAALSKISLIPGFHDQEFLGSGGIYDTLHFWIGAKNLNKGVTKATFTDKIAKSCSSYKDLKDSYDDDGSPTADEMSAQCANAVYEEALLYDDLDVKNMRAAKKDSSNDENNDYSYTLGYVVAQNLHN